MLAGGSGGWDGPESSSASRRPKAPPPVVPDNWEDDEEEEEDLLPVEEKNRKIWEQANHEAVASLPTFVASSGHVAPPPAAFQPALKILKRPVNNQADSSSTAPASTLQESIEDREARYQAARKRIFGEAPMSDDGSAVHLASKEGNPIIRNPRGPEETASPDAPPSKGFDRRMKPPTSLEHQRRTNS